MKVEKGGGSIGGGSGGMSQKESGSSASKSFVKPKTLVCYVW